MPKNNRKRLITVLTIQVIFSGILIRAAFADTTVTTLNQHIDEATLSVDIIDGDGATVSSPSVAFADQTFSFDPVDSTGTLGVIDADPHVSQIIRVANPTATEEWSLAISATGGGSAVWTDGGTNTYPYNDGTSADNGRLTVDPSSVHIDPKSPCSATTGLTAGSSGTFVASSVTSIDILTAGATAGPYCYYDLTAIALSQRIPASQVPASYTLGMTLTAI